MSETRKKRMSMLDTLAAAPAQPSMMSSNKALRSARDAVDAHHVWDLDPALIEDTRIKDRLDPADVIDLRHAIEANGQTVPILVRRHPKESDRYLLVYGRRRLEAIRQSDKVEKVRAIVTKLGENDAIRAQISENMARRDLTFIEKALFARELVDADFGTQSQIAEVLTVTKSSVSMALAIIDAIGADLARAIGPATGIGRPRWDALARNLEAIDADRDELIDLADRTRAMNAAATVLGDDTQAAQDPSVAAFEAVATHVERRAKRASKPPARPAAATEKARALIVDGQRVANVRRTAKGLQLDIANGGFADWLETEAEAALQELHARWKSGAED